MRRSDDELHAERRPELDADTGLRSDVAAPRRLAFGGEMNEAGMGADERAEGAGYREGARERPDFESVKRALIVEEVFAEAPPQVGATHAHRQHREHGDLKCEATAHREVPLIVVLVAFEIGHQR